MGQLSWMQLIPPHPCLGKQSCPLQPATFSSILTPPGHCTVPVQCRCSSCCSCPCIPLGMPLGQPLALPMEVPPQPPLHTSHGLAVCGQSWLSTLTFPGWLLSVLGGLCRIFLSDTSLGLHRQSPHRCMGTSAVVPCTCSPGRVWVERCR